MYTFSERSVGQGCATPDSSADYRRNFRRPMGVALAGRDHGGGPADLRGYPNTVRHRAHGGPLSDGQKVPYILYNIVITVIKYWCYNFYYIAVVNVLCFSFLNHTAVVKLTLYSFLS